MPRKNPLRWEIPSELEFDLIALESKSEQDFDTKTLKGHIDFLMFRALKIVSSRVDRMQMPLEEFWCLVQTEFQSLSETHPPTITQSTTQEIKVLSEDSWRALKEERLRNGIEHHRKEYENGRSLGVAILSPKILPGGDPPVQLRAVTLSFDHKLLYREHMLSLAQDILTEDFLLNERSNPILAEILDNVVSGEPLYGFSIAEMFELYGELVNHLPEDRKKRQLHSWIHGKGFKRKVRGDLLGNSFSAEYHAYSGNGYSTTAKPVPLPFAVRNTMAHQEASNPNVKLLKDNPHGVHDSVVILRAIKAEYFCEG